MIDSNKITAITFDDLPEYKCPVKESERYSFPNRNKKEFKVRKSKTINKPKEEKNYSLEEFNNLLSGLNGKDMSISKGPCVAKKSRS